MDLQEYNYNLPPELIAQSAVHPHDHCRLLIIKDHFEHKQFYQIIDYLEKGDILVINDSKVRRCKLSGTKSTGGKVEAVLLKQIAHLTYQTRIKGRNLKSGTTLLFPNNSGTIVSLHEDLFEIKFAREPQDEELELLTPSYIKNKIPEEDYQTIYAQQASSLAAPTAGLHFTAELLKKIEEKSIKIAKIQLDISFATFLPIRDLEHHSTGKESFSIDEKNAAIINSGNIIAVGTTVVKCLESAHWQNGKVLPTSGDSEIFIKPGHQFQAPIKALITNFHLPKSSLLLLTAAYTGRERLLKAYEEAVKQKYRFFSLGDAMMIFRE